VPTFEYEGGLYYVNHEKDGRINIYQLTGGNLLLHFNGKQWFNRSDTGYVESPQDLQQYAGLLCREGQKSDKVFV